MDCLIGLDIGTSAIKGILILEKGEILAQGKEKTSFVFPYPDYIEFDAEERYKLICTLIRSLSQQKPSNSKIRAISISGASGNALLLDKNKNPVQNAASWLDMRAESSYQELLSPFSDEYIYSICGWPKIGSFPLAYFAWMKKNKPEIYYSSPYKVTDFIYFNYKLTGCWMQDSSTATNFYLQDQINKKYHQPFLDFLEIDPGTLPEIINAGEQIGKITHQASVETGLSPDVFIVAGSFDHPSAARGTGMFQPGDLLISCGTSWVCFYPVPSREKVLQQKMLIDPFLSPGGPWGGMFSITNIGGIINQYVDALFLNARDRFAKLDRAASRSPLGSNKLFIDITQTKYSPREHLLQFKNKNHSDISRAIMESMAFVMREKIEYFREEGMSATNISMVGGPSESKIWPKILTDILGLPIKLIQGEYAGCLGASILAGIGIGLFKNEIDGFDHLKIKSVIVEPDLTNTEKYSQIITNNY
ncbi:MAG: FGGY family carbohydrate kinase [Prolixibacteraceae bacterium]|jgi:sugar (pentulose or hexulose) kinase|nr:FGGY family carbohydrate kinase [Prolixibacteraceae bacterium]